MKDPIKPFDPSKEQPTGIRQWLPGLWVLREYSQVVFAKDLYAGIVLAAILVPAGMGYAQAAGLPAICGLYATIVPLVAYALFGPSRILILGPDSSLSALIAAAILPLAVNDPSRTLPLAGMLAIVSGLLCMVAGIAKLGFITDLLSKPIRYGYINGIILTVLLGQLPTMLGFSVSGPGTIERVQGLSDGILQGRTSWTATWISIASLAIILACKYWLPKLPGVLVAVVGASIAVWAFDLNSDSKLAVVGILPQGLPRFSFPAVTVSELQALLLGSLAIALVSSADMSVLSRTYAQRRGHIVDANHELVALGIANVTTGLFQGFSVSASASRTPVAESAGAKTQVAGIVGAACIILLLSVAPALLRFLPHAALAPLSLLLAWDSWSFRR